MSCPVDRGCSVAYTRDSCPLCKDRVDRERVRKRGGGGGEGDDGRWSRGGRGRYGGRWLEGGEGVRSGAEWRGE